METIENDKMQLNILKDKLHRMLEDTDGIITTEIVEVSQALDDLIIQDIKRHNYSK